MQLKQIRLLANDFSKTVSFYRDVLDFPVRMLVEEVEYAIFDTGETKLEVLSRKQMAEVLGESELPVDAAAQSKFLFNCSVEDIDAYCTQLKAKGVTLLNEPHDRLEWDARVAHFRDPDGNVIEVYKHPLNA